MASLPSGRVGVRYVAAITVQGGVAPYSFSVTSGSLPPGLALATATGTVSGTPSASGKWSFQVTVTDSAGAKASKKYLLKISLL